MMMIKTLITAHSGAENTVDNTLESIRVMADCGADVIEIDVRMHEGRLVMSHDAPSGAVDSLEDAFAIVKAHPGLKMNIDLKQTGIVSAVAELAERCGVEDRLLFTGGVGEEDFPAIRTHGLTVWYNSDLMPEDADWLAGVDALGFDTLNLYHGDVDDHLLENAHRLSIWTVNDEELLRRFLAAGAKGITTRKPLLAMKLRDEIQK
jgi:glycerophosphoryl diester phosphodiesterase